LQARILEELYWLSQNHPSFNHYHELRLLQAINHEHIDTHVSKLSGQGLVELSSEGMIRLTLNGYNRAEQDIADTAGSEEK